MTSLVAHLPARFLDALGVAVLAAAPIAASAQPATTPRERCAELIAFFDRYGADRGEHSDGVRNHTRIGAGIDCERGNYAKGIKAMEDLLRRKAFTVPPSSLKVEEPQDIEAPGIPSR